MADYISSYGKIYRDITRDVLAKLSPTDHFLITSYLVVRPLAMVDFKAVVDGIQKMGCHMQKTTELISLPFLSNHSFTYQAGKYTIAYNLLCGLDNQLELTRVDNLAGGRGYVRIDTRLVEKLVQLCPIGKGKCKIMTY